MIKVCALVLNTISHDARVLKEADTLQQAGYDVTVVGVTDTKVTARHETLGNGVKIVRLDSAYLRNFAYRQLTTLAYIIIGLLVAMALLILPFDNFLSLTIAIGCILLVLRIVLLPFRFRGSVLISLGEKSGEISLRAPLRRGIGFVISKSAYLMKLLGLYLIAVRISPQVVHCHDAITLPVGVAVKHKLKCLLVYDAHEIYEEVAQASPERAKTYRAIHRHCQRYVDGFVTINRSIADWYAEHYPQLPAPVLVKNATKLAGAIDYDGRLHQAAGLARDRKVLLYQGGFSRKRGLEYLVESARYLTEGWALVMMGWGTLESHLRSMAEVINAERRSIGMPDAVVFIPPAPQRELVFWTAGGTVGVIPYEKIGLNHWFCTPNKLWEYPNAHLPVLVSPFPELGAPVREFGYGWLLPEEQDPKALGEMVIALTEEEIAQARANCAKFMQADNWQIYAEKLADLYRDLLEQHGLAGQAAA